MRSHYLPRTGDICSVDCFINPFPGPHRTRLATIFAIHISHLAGFQEFLFRAAWDIYCKANALGNSNSG